MPAANIYAALISRLKRCNRENHAAALVSPARPKSRARLIRGISTWRENSSEQRRIGGPGKRQKHGRKGARADHKEVVTGKNRADEIGRDVRRQLGKY